jgi:hypothetical protein
MIVAIISDKAVMLFIVQKTFIESIESATW